MYTFAIKFKINTQIIMTKRQIFKLNTLFILLLMICVHSCEEQNFEDKDSSNSDKNSSFEIIELKSFLKDRALSAIDMNKSFGKSKHTLTYTRSNSKSNDFIPDWSTLQNYKDEEGNVVYILNLKTELPISGLIYFRDTGKEKTHINITTSKLVIWKLNGVFVGRIMTYIPDYKFSRDPLNNVMQLGYDIEGSNYSGVRLVSTLDGIFLYGDKYDEGQNLFHFLPSKLYCNTVFKQDSVLIHSHDNNISKKQIYFKLFSEKSRLSTRAVYTTEEEDEFICSFCGKPADECTCLIITPPAVYCPRCGMDIKHCLCCHRCNFYPCICCSSCLHYPCICCRVCRHYPCICCKLCHNYPCSCSFNGGEGGGGTNPNPEDKPDLLKPNIKIPYAAKDFPGYKFQGKDCYKLADYILHQLISDYSEPGVPYCIKKVDGNGNVINTGNAITVFNLINKHLDANRPIKVGVDYHRGGNLSDNITDHWIVVNGRGYDTIKQQYYFTYIETGRYKNSAAKAVGDNRLYYDDRKGTISGPKWTNKHTYIVNQIKININK